MSKIRILVVDDDQDFAESLADVLKEHECQVDLAFTGEDAIERFRQTDYDITFMDVVLPNKNGVESFLEIRNLKPDACVIMMTGFSVEQLLDEALEEGAWDVLHKPLDMADVLRDIERLRPSGVLLADDDPDFIDSVRELLEQHGYDVFVAQDGREAITRIRTNGIDVLILDLRMPILNGVDVCLELRRSGHAIPTIIVTSYADQEVDALNKLRACKVSGILTKPFDPRELLRTLQSLIDRKIA